MSKFKVGDKVRMVKEHRYIDNNPSVKYKVGEVYTISDVSLSTTPGIDYLHFKELGGWFGYGERADKFELVPDSSELEELVKKANEGYVAIEKIHSHYKNAVEFQEQQKGRGWEPLYASNPGQRFFRVLQAPKFEPFTVGSNWVVKLEGDIVKVGCKDWEIAYLLSNLKNINGGAGALNNFRGTKNGVQFNEHLISWADSEKIVAALEKSGVK